MLENKEELQQINLEILANQVVEGFITGLHKSPFHGFSVEFAEHRLYNTGESVKNIDWKLFGRTDKLFTKRFEEETNLRCQLVIDASSSMYYPEGKDNKLQFSVYCAAALINLLKRQRDAFGLSVFADKVVLSTPAKSTTPHQRFLYFELEKLMADRPKQKTTAIVNALHEIAENIHKRSMVVIFSDMMESKEDEDDLFSALQHLKHNKHEVILFNVTDKRHEQDFRFENRPYLFVDVENGEEIKVQPGQVKEQYLKAMTEFKHNLMLKCAQYRIDFIDADMNEGFYPVLNSYLVKRNKMM
ncbi:DUF58 domain-containing protein [Solitalea canadensis]|uniref:DUF58 domain-containing protein n=1 Tax=Solitalea canadensis (strain ATCC 29591 / DSM 3403 / JCM 21819 / LMG 8368 / NBRC 15130 / NCIMB 12057 / USAM 9D) TaxID=929556 RepID=H8KXY1_SOLCM|nr:DUF58 domain-containing protein [Solitalea canadensis]AFD05657.1 hypothetical protein Solca_0526 [Solitalea canadensis DSM 3403]